MAEDFSGLMKGRVCEFEYEDIEALSGVINSQHGLNVLHLAWNALRKGIEQSKHEHDKLTQD